MSTSTSSRRSATTRRTSMTIRNIRLTAILKPEDVIHSAQTEDGEEILALLLRHLALDYGIGNLKTATGTVMRNIKDDPGHGRLRQGILVPYARLEKVVEPLIAVATSEAGFTFGDLGEDRFHVVAVVLVPLDMPGAYKQIHKGLEKIFPDPETAAEVGRLRSALAVWQHFDSGGTIGVTQPGHRRFGTAGSGTCLHHGPTLQADCVGTTQERRRTPGLHLRT